MIKQGQRYRNSDGFVIEIIREHMDGWVYYHERMDEYEWSSGLAIKSLYTLITPFFEKDKSYRYTHSQASVYTVRHVETFSNGAKAAFAVCGNDAIVLVQLDFEGMIEVQD